MSKKFAELIWRMLSIEEKVREVGFCKGSKLLIYELEDSTRTSNDLLQIMKSKSFY